MKPDCSSYYRKRISFKLLSINLFYEISSCFSQIKIKQEMRDSVDDFLSEKDSLPIQGKAR